MNVNINGLEISIYSGEKIRFYDSGNSQNIMINKTVLPILISTLMTLQEEIDMEY